MIRKTLVAFVLVQLLQQDTVTYANKNVFRKDYTYLEETQSFYKIHTITKPWREAKKRCAMEGATLFYPEDAAETDAVIDFWNRTQTYSWIYIGVSDIMSEGVFETVDGQSINEVYSVWGPGEPNDAGGKEDCVVLNRDGTLNDDSCEKMYTFACKKSLASLDWNVLCDMPDPSYQYDSANGKCYKFHLTPMSWTDAHSVCSTEMSYLAVINSEKEAAHLKKLTAEAPKDGVGGDYLRGAVHLGYHNRDGEGWKTVRGTSLADSGYMVWGEGQPDGGANEPCGTMFYSGRLNDLACERKCFFICEHDIPLLIYPIPEHPSSPGSTEASNEPVLNKNTWFEPVLKKIHNLQILMDYSMNMSWNITENK